MRRRELFIGLGALGLGGAAVLVGGERLAHARLAISATEHLVTRFDLRGQPIWTHAGLGREVGQFCNPAGGLVDALGQAWVVDRGNHRIELFDVDGRHLHRIDQAIGARLHLPSGIAAFGDRVWVSDTGNHRLLACDLDGRLEVVSARFKPNSAAPRPARHAGGPAGRSDLDLRFNGPSGLAAGRALYVADTGNGRIVTLDRDGRSRGALLGPDHWYPRTLELRGNRLIAQDRSGRTLHFDV